MKELLSSLFFSFYSAGRYSYLCTEYVPGGSLNDFLRRNRSTISIRKWLKMVLTAINGMMYLVEQGIVHRGIV